MNTIIRGVRNAFRNVVRTGSIVVILSISIGLVIAMLAARQAVDTKIEDLKSSVGNTISISPAGFRGFEGGGSALTTEQLEKVKELAHVTGVTSSLSDRLSTDDTTNLESGIELGSLGGRFAPPTSSGSTAAPSTEGSENTDTEQPTMSRGNPMSSITITGVDNVESASIFGGSSVTWTSGQAFDATADDNEAAIGKALAEKNSLSVGDSFTAYGQELTVVGIYDTGTEFANNGVFVSLSTLQRLSDQADSITSATATVDSIDNLSTVTTAITDTLGSDTVDVTNSQETVDSTVAPLESVRTIALYSLIGAVVAGSVIILLTMIMIVRERRREIGVMKAIGATNSSIMKQFVAEAMTLTAMGLVVGLVFGIVAATPVTNMLVNNSSSTGTSQSAAGPSGRSGSGERTPGGGRGAQGGGFAGGREAVRGISQTAENIQSSVGIGTLLAGVFATLLIALLGSAVPAFMISNIKPAEAMRSE